jgi:uncharacterized protein (DUF1800 family)
MNRRNFLTIGAPQQRLGKGAQLKHDGIVQTPPVFARRSDTGLEPHMSVSGAWGYTEAAHLLRRGMIGPTDAEIRKAVTDGLDTTVDNLLKPFTVPLTLIADWAGKDPQVRIPNTDPTTIQAFQAEVTRKRDTLERWWHLVIATSPVSIQERMTLFWHNHFVSQITVVNISEWMLGQNQLLRQNSLGNFKQFVKDVTKDMAMLMYLDGVKNFKNGNRNNINENYARELQELFTMGVVDWDGNPNYSQTDVSEAARALSGWTFSSSQAGPYNAGLKSQFLEGTWDSGNKTYLGQTGKWKADDIVDIIFSQRGDQVAKYICGKLYRAFVYDVIDPVVVTEMANTLKSGNWELKPVMLQLLKSAHFFDVTNIGALEKSPADYMIGMVRGLGLTSVPDFNTTGTGRNTRDFSNRLGTQGMSLFDPPNVKGWQGGRTWISTSTLPLRQKFGIDVAAGVLKVAGTKLYVFDPIAFAKTFPTPGDIHALSADMAKYLMNADPSTKEEAALFDALLDSGVDYEWDINDPDQKADSRIRKFLDAAVRLAKYQLY